MHVELADESAMELVELRASDGLAVRALPNGCLYAIQRNEILINQILASPVAGGVHRVFLRVHDAGETHFTEIVGPAATSEFTSARDRLVYSGTWRGLRYRCTCWLHPGVGGAWFHHVEVENTSDTSARCDAILVQDVGLATRGQGCITTS